MKRPELPVLTTLRFPAAFAIVLYHFFPYTHVPHWVYDGFNAGVSFFYVLSGFILYYNYAELKDRGYFWISRLARIWPVHLITALLAILFIPWFHLLGHDSWRVTLPANLLLIHAWFPFKGSALSYNGVSWSLSVEAFFYLTFPWLLILIKRRGGPFAVICAFVVGFVLVALTTKFWPAHADFVSTFNPVGRLFEFVLGMATGKLWMMRNDLSGNSCERSLREIALGLICLGVMIVMPAAVKASGEANPLLFWLGSTVDALGFAVLIWTYAHQSGAISKILSHRVLTWFGEVSFSVYMCHQIVLNWLLFSHEGKDHTYIGADAWRLFAIYAVLTLLISAALFHLVETPARRAIVSAYKRRLSR